MSDSSRNREIETYRRWLRQLGSGPMSESPTAAPPAGTVSRPFGTSYRSTGQDCRAFLTAPTKKRLLRILKKADRAASGPIMWLAEEAYLDGTLDSLLPQARVPGASRKKGPVVTFYAPPRWLQQFVDKAWELEVYCNSASHLLGLGIERQLARKPDDYWVELFYQGEDIIARILRHNDVLDT